MISNSRFSEWLTKFNQKIQTGDPNTKQYKITILA